MATSQNSLFEYGIQNEVSDIRAHVAVICKRVYVFRTRAMQMFIEANRETLCTGLASQPGVVGPTANGYKVPVNRCANILRVIPCEAYPWEQFPNEKSSTSEKGAAAVKVILRLLKHGRFPLWVDTFETDRANVQIRGTDVLLYAGIRIQVKCDYAAGPRELGGTGNLYLQFAERNPRKFT